MQLRLHAKSLPSIDLSADERRHFAEEAAAVIAENVRIEAACRAHKYEVSAKYWKPVRHHQGFTVYRERGSNAPSRDAKPAAKPRSQEPELAQTFISQDELEEDEVVTDCHASHRRRDWSKTVVAEASDDLCSSFDGATDWSKSVFGGASDDLCSSFFGAAPTTRGDEAVDRMDWNEMATDPTSLVGQMKDPHSPMIIATGEHDGTVEDCVFGSLATDPISRQLRTSVIKDKVGDAKLLACIHGPTLKDPCRFLGIKWLMRDLPPMLEPFIHPRDHLVLESSGYVDDDDGGYSYLLLHSVDLPQFPEFEAFNIVRSKVSMCFIARRTALPDRVRIFARGFSNPRGHLSVRAAVWLTSDAMIAATRSPECAQIKKLQWLMQCRHTAHDKPRSKPKRECGFCYARAPNHLRVALGLAEVLTTCLVCGDTACGRCVVHKDVLVAVARDEAVPRTITVCVSCNLKAKNQSAFDVARATYQAPVINA